jgi:membrane-bound serine protease (ClpP class)
MVVPGVVGAICLILFAVSTQILPINALGLLLIAAGIVLFVLEFKFASYGALTVAGVVLLVLGSMFMFENDPRKVLESPEFKLQASWSVILPSVIAMGAFTLFVAYKVIRAQVRKGLTGQEGLVGEIGVAATGIAADGKILLQGAYWDATADEPIEKGAKVQVVAASGLAVKVKKL